jgi:GNAT superfamily N-acetyltransferase
MNELDGNQSFLEIIPSAPDVSETEWESYEKRWGKYGTSGFTRLILAAAIPSIFGHSEPVDIIVDLYRGEDGQLLGIYYSQIVEGSMDDGTLKNTQKPIMIYVHPHHQRKGIGTKMADNAVSKFLENQGYEWDYNLGLKELRATGSGSDFSNKYIQKTQEERNTDYRNQKDFQ